MPLYFTEDNVTASICRESFFEFVQEFWDTIIADDPVFNWHIPYLCAELEDVAFRVGRRVKKKHDLIINIPPGTTKSTIVSQMFPAWVWTWMPSARFVCGSYAERPAHKDSIFCRDIIQSRKYQKMYPLKLREDQNTKGLFNNNKKGSRLSCGVGSPPTGFHGHFIIVDDPLNPEEAYSEVELERANRWMGQSLSSRKASKDVTPTILVMQRLHQNDPTGHLLNLSGTGEFRKIKHINLPGEATEHISPPELQRFYRNGLLDPDRLSRDVLNEMRGDLGEYGYASQVLQTPVPLGGGVFKVDQIQIEPEPPRQFTKKVRYWDKAGSQDKGAYSVGVLMGVDVRNRFWVLDVKRDRLDSARREALIKQTAEVDGSSVEINIEQEPGSGGKESAENTVKNLSGFTVKVDRPTGDKIYRADPFSTQVNIGNVYVLNRPWTSAYLEELQYFPNSTYKDQVDASSGAFNRIHLGKKKRAGGAQ